MYQRVLFLIGLMIVMGWVAVPVGAATVRVLDIPLGKVISLNGQKFVKVRNDATKGSQFVMVQQFYPATTMQGWNGCNALATPTATNFTQGPILIDARDGKSYEIRKFADGKCWMVDNLMYGGATDNCAGVDAAGYTNASYGGANGSASYSNRFGANTYGNCRDPRVGATISSPCYNSTACGYYYNWQGAMQHSSAYYGVNYTGLTTNVQGICPQGWHIPTGGTASEFAILDEENGGSGVNRVCYYDVPCNFWRPGFAYKAIYSGLARTDGSLYDQGSRMSSWSFGEDSVTYAFGLTVANSAVYPLTGSSTKNTGNVIRCVKD